LEEETRLEGTQSKLKASDDVETDTLDHDFLFVKIFPPCELIHVHFPKNLFDFVVEYLVHHLLPIFILETILNTESFGRLDDHIELVGGGLVGELTFDIEGDRLLFYSPKHVSGVGGDIYLVPDLLPDVDDNFLEDVFGILGNGRFAFEGILVDV